MGFGQFESISTLKVTKYNSAIRVRVQALWKGVSRDTQEFRGLNMILVDDSSDRIHGFVSAKYAHLFEEELEEGKIISLKNFAVKDYVGDENNRTLRNEKHIYLSNDTKLKKGPVDGLKIPKYAFDLFDLEDIRKIYTDSRFLVDVIGVIDGVEGKTLFKKENEERSHVKFEITNGRMNVKVTFFGSLGDQFQTQRKAFGDDPTIITICCAKVNEWDDKMNLTNYPATRFYLNADHYSVNSLMSKAKAPSFKTQDNVEIEEEVTYISTVNEIKNLDHKYKGKNVTCEIIVRRIEETKNWYYNKCTKCPKELSLVDGNYVCDNCNRIIPYPSRRFRILAICSDDTGYIPIIFPDHEVRKIIGKCVFEVRLEDETAFPKLLTQFENQKYTITLEISEDNILKSSDAYTATVISPVVELICSPTKFEAEEEQVHDTSMITVTDNQDTLSKGETPTTKKSTTKGKGRRILDDEHAPLSLFKHKKKSGGPLMTGM